MDELVSVIISVYNDKTYLQRAFDSVREQSYRNLEVIVVDDCSTDGSGEFCDEYCKQDARFRVIHHEKNTGVSGPRNTGLKHAKGDYIYFLDSDDYLPADAMEVMHAEALHTSADVVSGELILFYPETGKEVRRTSCLKYGSDGYVEILKRLAEKGIERPEFPGPDAPDKKS